VVKRRSSHSGECAETVKGRSATFAREVVVEGGRSVPVVFLSPAGVERFGVWEDFVALVVITCDDG
jgi:hypothetical protein